MRPGTVYLVGAGPGDHKLITVRGKEYLEKADVIVYDRLVDSRILQYARPDAQLIYAGKQAGCHALSQEKINRLLVEKAGNGHIVVRLKGGDPFVFGRGGEEALHLAAAGIPFEVVPGVTSAVAVPAYAGIPVTHRGVAESVAIVTGHEDPAKTQSGLRWEKLATGTGTLIFLMGVGNLAAIADQLIRHGRPENEPAALAQSGTTPDQKVVVTTLQRAAQDAAERHITPPAVFIVGQVVTLRERLTWFDCKPLMGKTVLVTRTREQARFLTDELEEWGARCVEAPAIRIMPPERYDAIDQAIRELEEYDWLIFTSRNGVQAFFDRLHALGRDARALGRACVAAIGVPTAERIRQEGILADVVPGDYRAEGVLEALQGKIRPGMKVLIPRAAQARPLLPDTLREAGAHVVVAPVYRTVLAESDRDGLAGSLTAGQIDVIAFTSSSTVAGFLHTLGDESKALLAGVKIACIGPVTAGACLDYGLEPDIIAETFTMKGLAEAIAQAYREGLA